MSEICSININGVPLCDALTTTPIANITHMRNSSSEDGLLTVIIASILSHLYSRLNGVNPRALMYLPQNIGCFLQNMILKLQMSRNECAVIETTYKL